MAFGAALKKSRVACKMSTLTAEKARWQTLGPPLDHFWKRQTTKPGAHFWARRTQQGGMCEVHFKDRPERGAQRHARGTTSLSVHSWNRKSGPCACHLACPQRTTLHKKGGMHEVHNTARFPLLLATWHALGSKVVCARPTFGSARRQSKVSTGPARPTVQGGTH